MRAQGCLMRRQTISAEDERAISHLLLRYATSIDTRDWPLFRTCFSPDCEADYGSFGSWRGLREIVEYMEACHSNLGSTLYRISNITIDDRNDEVLARSYVDAIFTEAAQKDVARRTLGFFDDALVRTSEGWKIARRRFTMVLSSLG